MSKRLKTYVRRSRIYQKLGRIEMYLRGKFFDLRHGVRTAGRISLKDLKIEGSSVKFGLPYSGMDPRLLRVILESLTLQHEDFVFVDLGSGMGRVLLVASEFSFKKIIGVEFSSELHQQAELNIAHYRNNSRRCKDVQSVCADAAQFSFPPSPLVIFLFNPFSERILSAVTANIRKSLDDHPRDILVIYVNPECGFVWDADPAFAKILSHDWYSIYANTGSLAKVRTWVRN